MEWQKAACFCSAACGTADCGSATRWRYQRDRLIGNKLFLYTAKTGTHVYCPLPDFVVNALEAVRSDNAQYFFWTGESAKDGAASTTGDTS